MILGVGCDLAEHARFQKGLERSGDRFAEAFLSVKERVEWRRRAQANPKRGAAYLAGRWAAKESLSKALGSGVRGDVVLTDITVLNDNLGAPYFEFTGALALLVQREKLKFFLSLSDTDTLSMASVVCERID